MVKGWKERKKAAEKAARAKQRRLERKMECARAAYFEHGGKEVGAGYTLLNGSDERNPRPLVWVSECF
jgi:hypothetical protein